jgi:hypothetical protein
MNLLITKSNPTTFWGLKDDSVVTKLIFPDYFDHDLCQPTLVHCSPLPWEIVSNILGYTFKMYLQTRNFDLAIDLLLVKKDMIDLTYKSVYGNAPVNRFEKYRRLVKTLDILESIHDTYITVLRQRRYSILKLVRNGDPCLDTLVNPWDFTFDIFIEPLSGVIQDETSNPEVYYVGPLYGDQVWVTGKWRKGGVFWCEKLVSPVINLKFVDIFDTLQLTHNRLTCNANFERFFNLLRVCYGSFTGIYVMTQSENEVSPFVSHSDTFVSF